MSPLGSSQQRYPSLYQFLASEWIQDPEDERKIPERVISFITTNYRPAVQSVRTDIRRFLEEQGNRIDMAFEEFNPQFLPTAYGMNVEQFLIEVEALFRLNEGDHAPGPDDGGAPSLQDSHHRRLPSKNWRRMLRGLIRH